ncbi:MAG: aldehyde dehydrogenase family protein, partial [Steroidobacteraceae bacterium]
MTDDIRGNIPFEDWPLYINGQACQPASSAFFEADDPYTGKVWARVARGSAADVDRAVAAAQCAFPAWSGLAPAARARTMLRLAELVEADAERLARLEVRDNGKLLAEMLPQVRLVAEWFRYFAGLADKIQGAVIPTGKPDILTFTR